MIYVNKSIPVPQPLARGKHYRAYREGHTVRVTKADGTVEERHFTLEDGAVMLDPDLKARFPDSESVNRAPARTFGLPPHHFASHCPRVAGVGWRW